MKCVGSAHLEKQGGSWQGELDQSFEEGTQDCFLDHLGKEKPERGVKMSLTGILSSSGKW